MKRQNYGQIILQNSIYLTLLVNERLVKTYNESDFKRNRRSRNNDFVTWSRYWNNRRFYSHM